MTIEQIEKIVHDAEAAIQAAKSLDDLKLVKTKFLGRADGALTKVLRGLSQLPIEERKAVGPLAQEAREKTDAAIAAREHELVGASASAFDPTLPPLKPLQGHLHPLTQVKWLLEDLFSRMGFIIEDGPEVESEWYNFDALNMPFWHPARDMQDTFYVEVNSDEVAKQRLVLRTQTSPVQIRAMEKYGVPLRCIVPGQVYRNEATDARHENTFWQIEGLMIDKDISLAHLNAVSRIFLRELFGNKVEMRVRPGYFPFTEPSVEMDITCQICTGTGARDGARCPVCKGTGWLEFMGAGLVHPRVLKNGGVDPKKYSGFAFGFGLTRLAMMKYGIDNVRMLASGDMRFLKQF